MPTGGRACLLPTSAALITRLMIAQAIPDPPAASAHLILDRQYPRYEIIGIISLTLAALVPHWAGSLLPYENPKPISTATAALQPPVAATLSISNS